MLLARQPIRLQMKTAGLLELSRPIAITKLVEFETGDISDSSVDPTVQVIQGPARSSQETISYLSLGPGNLSTIEPILAYSFPKLTSLSPPGTGGRVEIIETFVKRHSLLTRLCLCWNRSFPAHGTPRTVSPEDRRTQVRCGRVQLACL
jgi:hypothetical protein